MAIYMNDPETEALVRALADGLGVSVTLAIKRAVENQLDRDNIARPVVETVPVPARGREGLKKQLDAVIRSATKEYTRLRAKATGKRRGGSRVYQMLGLHGPVETLKRLIEGSSEGLVFLAKLDPPRLDLSAEEIALDPRFESIIDVEIRAKARVNRAAVRG